MSNYRCLAFTCFAIYLSLSRHHRSHKNGRSTMTRPIRRLRYSNFDFTNYPTLKTSSRPLLWIAFVKSDVGRHKTVKARTILLQGMCWCVLIWNPLASMILWCWWWPVGLPSLVINLLVGILLIRNLELRISSRVYMRRLLLWWVWLSKTKQNQYNNQPSYHHKRDTNAIINDKKQQHGSNDEMLQSAVRLQISRATQIQISRACTWTWWQLQNSCNTTISHRQCRSRNQKE